MIVPRRSEDRGHANHGWLDSHHTFSFAGYHDPRFTGFHDLLVINEDRVTAGAGFGAHGHRDMEIVSYVLEGALEHQDSMGTGSVLRPGDVQRMSAGTGVRHSEFNHSSEHPLHLLQIWILPEQEGLEPSYEEKHFDPAGKQNRLRLFVSPDGREGSLRINQDASIYATVLHKGRKVSHFLGSGRSAWIQLMRGSVEANGILLRAGDGAAIEDEKEINLSALESSEVLLFDLRSSCPRRVG